ncbi:MAG: PQQ-binding-like beta-propeller repeat protein [Gemmataceae bacterium]|nr:PQQ-binding-like beta-propeller repeat protein [Gemmataceae bacterium]
MHLILLAALAADWPQWRGPARDGVWPEKGVLARFPKDGPVKLWTAPVAGGYAGPAVAGGKVYVPDFATKGDVKKQSEPPRPDKALAGKERLLCLDARTGKQLWKHEYGIEARVSYPTGPRATPTVEGGRVYGLGMVGNLYCLDAETGKPVWQKDLVKEYEVEVPIWGFCSHPLVAGDKLYVLVGAKGGLCVCFDKKTGKELWKALDGPEPGYSTPALVEEGGKKRLLVFHPEGVASLDPETGKAGWSVEVEPLYKMSIMAPVKSGDLLFAGGIGNRSVMLELGGDKPKVLWRGKEGMRGKPMTGTGFGPVNMTPMLEGDVLYGVDQPGTFLAVDAKTGKRLWHTFKPTTGEKEVGSGTAFLIKNGDRHFLFSEKGELVIAKLSREKYEEIDRAKLVAPTSHAFGRNVVWTHPAFADKCVFVRNDKELACFSLAE